MDIKLASNAKKNWDSDIFIGFPISLSKAKLYHDYTNYKGKHCKFIVIMASVQTHTWECIY